MYRERDEFDQVLSDLKKQHGYLEATHQAVVKERDDLSSQVKNRTSSAIVTQNL